MSSRFLTKLMLGIAVIATVANAVCAPASAEEQSAPTPESSAYAKAALHKVLDVWCKSHVAQAAKSATTISFSVTKNGTVSKLFITGSSGNSHQDYAAVETIIGASAFPPLPSGTADTISIEAHLGSIAESK